MLFLAITFASLLMSLIPAGLVKLVLSMAFNQSASYLMILAIMAVTYAAATMGVIGLGYDTEASMDAMPDWLTLGFPVVTYLFQALVMAIIITDQNNELIGLSRWFAALLLPSAVTLLLGLA